VTTASTKSRVSGGSKSKSAGNRAEMPSTEPASADSTFFDDRRNWYISAGAVLALSAFVRLYLLSLNPLHHDEGVNGYFLTHLLRDHIYRYDPANYHGPTLYYLALAVARPAEFLFGKDAALTTFGIRLVPVLFGIATVWLVLSLRRYIGAIGALSAALLLAVSPGAVYMSRYFIHETLFTFFTLGIVVAALRFYETKDIFYLLLAALSAGMLFATKETAIISLGVLVIALVCVWIYNWLFPGKLDSSGWEGKQKKSAKLGAEFVELISRFGGKRILVYGIAVAAVFIAINVLFYSSFFTNWKGVSDSLETFKYWTKTGRAEHTKPPYQYVIWLVKEEGGILFLGAVGAVLVLLKGRNRFALFCALWAFGILAAYSLISYKTPWIAINFIVPLTIVAGYGIATLWGMARDGIERLIIAVVFLAVISITAVQMISLNFFRYDDDRYPYVYAHTERTFLDMIKEVDRVAKIAGTDEQTNIAVMAPEYWPLPWYQQRYTHVGYFGRVSNSGEPIVIAADSQEAEFTTAFPGKYKKVGSYKLRPGVTLSVFVRKDVPT
jgi:uncharacterized protein (TIGR03663 family)